MARKRYSDEEILRLLREIELKLAEGSDVQTACRAVGISDATYYNWRRRFGGMGRAKLSEFRDLEKENARSWSHSRSPCHVANSWTRMSVSWLNGPFYVI